MSEDFILVFSFISSCLNSAILYLQEPKGATFCPDLSSFGFRCLVKDESERYTAAQLLNHSFFRKTTMHFSPKHVAEEVAMERNISPEMVHDLLALSQLSNGQSRLNSEFEFLQHLGKGAFGDVIKVKDCDNYINCLMTL